MRPISRGFAEHTGAKLDQGHSRDQWEARTRDPVAPTLEVLRAYAILRDLSTKEGAK